MSQDFNEEKSSHKLELLRRKEEEESVKILSQKYKLPYVNLGLLPIEIDALKIIPEEKSRLAEIVVVQTAGKKLKIAVRNPEKEETKKVLKNLEEQNYTYDLFLVSKDSLEHVWQLYKKIPAGKETYTGSIEIAHEKIASLEKEITRVEEVKQLVEKTFFGKTTEALEIILGGALATETSDVHIEPQEKEARLRFRLDGVLYDVVSLPQKLYALLLSRIKLISELKLNVHDKAQDGRFTIKTDHSDMEVRTSILPGPDGENVVLRILNPKTINVPFEELGMQPWVINTLEQELKKPNGMIITTGPTGSGKTTTLYAFLKKVHTPTIKVITIEDPIEYRLPGIEQTQADAEKGYDFAVGLRSILRQDPDVILVGEIRDLETAETALHASLTGHLVFSTLHTNDAAGTIPRLIDLGAKPAIIAPAINITMAQRLVRKLCTSCRVTKKLSSADKNQIKKELALFPKGIPVPPENSWKIYSSSPQGCDACNQTGYKGRIGVFEIIQINEALEQIILRDPSEFEIKKTAADQGQINIRQDGILKVLAGITDFDELERVVGV
mgnify:CR=1 FL=1